MTLVIYEPQTPAIELIGHAGFAPRGQDTVCAACSILMFSLLRAMPSLRFSSGDGYARLSGESLPQSEKRQAAFDFCAGGYELLAENYPRHVSFRRKRQICQKGTENA